MVVATTYIAIWIDRRTPGYVLIKLLDLVHACTCGVWFFSFASAAKEEIHFLFTINPHWLRLLGEDDGGRVDHVIFCSSEVVCCENVFYISRFIFLWRFKLQLHSSLVAYFQPSSVFFFFFVFFGGDQSRGIGAGNRGGGRRRKNIGLLIFYYSREFIFPRHHNAAPSSSLIH